MDEGGKASAKETTTLGRKALSQKDYGRVVSNTNYPEEMDKRSVI